MAKDPAFLFYPNDFQGGTGTLSRHLKGCYIDLLIAQFNNGHLSLEEIRTVLGSDFTTAWSALSKKFAQDAAGKFFNERLETEIKKRKEYTDSRRRNLESKKDKSPPHIATHMDGHMEDRNGTANGNGTEYQGGAGGFVPGEPPSQEQVEQAFVDSGLTVEDGSAFYRRVNGYPGWVNIHSWTDYTGVAIARLLAKKPKVVNEEESRKEIVEFFQKDFRKYRPQEAAKFDREHSEGVPEQELRAKRDRIITDVVEEFWEHYKTRGWVVPGGVAIVDRLSAFKVWMKKEKQFAK